MKKYLSASFGVSIAVALSISLFMIALNATVNLFLQYWQFLVFLLPMVGFFMFCIQKLPFLKNIGDSEMIIEEIRNPSVPISPWLAPYIFLMTLLSHLFGACVGRESTAIQMGASISEFIGKWLHQDRPFLLRLGLATGFSAAFGTPIAGFVFSLEHPQHFNKKTFQHAFWIGLGSFVSFYVSKFIGPEHFLWPEIEIHFINFNLHFFLLLSLGLATVSIFYELILHYVKNKLQKFPQVFVLLSTGALLTLLTFAVASTKYNGLGTNLTQIAMHESLTWKDFFLKGLFLLLSVGAGFKGGEVTPLLSLAAAFASSFTGSVAMVAMSISCFFSYRLRAPLAGVIILLEFFNWKIAILGCLPILLTWALHITLGKLLKSSTLKIYY